MEVEADDDFNIASGLNEAKDSKVVERQLVRTCLKLSETEVNVKLFSKMVKNGVATNDVRNFVAKQALLKSSNHCLDPVLIRRAMRNKLVDACSLARSLRLKKMELEKVLRYERWRDSRNSTCT